MKYFFKWLLGFISFLLKTVIVLAAIAFVFLLAMYAISVFNYQGMQNAMKLWGII